MAFYKTRNTKTRNYGTRKNAGTEKQRNNGTLAEKAEYHEIAGILAEQHQEILPLRSNYTNKTNYLKNKLHKMGKSVSQSVE